MNRRQKIIVSVTGIFLVLLVLVGLTYAFFLTRIKGNENPTSISVTTADLRLVYEDDTNEVIGGEKLEPSDTVYTKTFTVTNEGNVNIKYGVYLIDVINTFARKDDIKYTLECSTTGSIQCNQILTDTTFPSGISQLVTNEIEPGKVHTYTFRFTYKDTGTDQSIDMGKQLSAKIQIFGKNENNEYFPHEEESLVYNIVKNAKSTTLEQSETLGYAYYSPVPLTKPAEKASGTNESTLSITEDDYGDSYYFRGNVKNNYVNFAGMCWKIVRIEGDGSVKLILEDRNEQCNDKEGQDLNNNGTYYNGNWSDGHSYVFGYDSNPSAGFFNHTVHRADFFNYTETDGLQSSFQTFQTYLAEKIDTNLNDELTKTEINTVLASKLKTDEWCYDAQVANKSTFYSNFHDAYLTDEHYAANMRLMQGKPSLKCTGKKLTKYKDETNMYVATLTVDEMSFAGSTRYNEIHLNYLMNNYKTEYGYNLDWWALSVSYYYEEDGSDNVFFLQGDGIINDYFVETGMSSRPAVTLKPGILITGGEGTQEQPYEIKMN